LLTDVDTHEGRGSTTAGAGASSRLRRIASRRFPLFGEMAFLAGVIACWQLARIPLEGGLAISTAHAHDWLALERALYLDIEASIIQWAHDADLYGLLRWGYLNFHLPVLFGFMALVRQLRPERYPFLRTAFLLSHVPALMAIGLYPLLPPRWLAGMPLAIPAPADMNGAMHNATAAVASQHVGYPILIATAVVWMAPRSRLAWLAWLYPATVFLIVVGTRNHYTLDAIVGGLCVAFGFVAARLIHGRVSYARVEATPPLALALLGATGYALVVRAIDMASDLTLPPSPVNGTDLALIVGTAAVVAAWWWSRSGAPPAPHPHWERTPEGQPQDARSGA
jgi:hypothetical protein